MTTARPGIGEIILTTPASPRLCHSRACSRAGRLAQIIVRYGVLADPGASPHSRDALWPESWGGSCPMCATCWDDTRQVAVKYRPRLVICDITRSPASQESSQGGYDRPGPCHRRAACHR